MYLTLMNYIFSNYKNAKFIITLFVTIKILLILYDQNKSNTSWKCHNETNYFVHYVLIKMSEKQKRLQYLLSSSPYHYFLLLWCWELKFEPHAGWRCCGWSVRSLSYELPLRMMLSLRTTIHAKDIHATFKYNLSSTIKTFFTKTSSDTLSSFL